MMSRWNPHQMSKPPQPARLDVVEPLPDVSAPQPISEAELSHPVEEAHFGRLYSQSRTYSHYPQLMAINEGKNKY